jgi:putative two-component system response regulator
MPHGPAVRIVASYLTEVARLATFSTIPPIPPVPRARAAPYQHNRPTGSEPRTCVLLPKMIMMLDLLTRLQYFGYEVTRATNGREALEALRSGQYQLVISDWEMPEMSGLDLCREIRSRVSVSYTYFILLTARTGTQNLIEGLRAGADEFLSKPVDPDELEVRLCVAERILSLESRDLVIFSLAKLAEARDPETGAHLERIREYCRVLGQSLCKTGRHADLLDGMFVQMLYMTSPLHDIGKSDPTIFC